MQNNQNSVHTLHLDRYNGVIIGGKERHQSYVQADALRIEEIENQDELHPCTQNGHQRGQSSRGKRWKFSLQGIIASVTRSASLNV
jgi:hypothetical protein